MDYPITPDDEFRANFLEEKLKKSQDLAQSLADALEAATDQLEKAVSGERIDTKAVNQILERSALAAFRAMIEQMMKELTI